MEYIQRVIGPEIQEYLDDIMPRGVILAGIVGVGKTTLAQHLISILSNKNKIFSFSGDDIQFRQAIDRDSRYLIKEVRSKTSGKALIFVDEIQKTPEILDALKLAFDEERVSFIVTGSEPEYLLNEAKRRLQRRARAFYLYPLGLNEIYFYKKLCDKVPITLWAGLFEGQSPEQLLSFKGEWDKITADFSTFRQYGTIPLVYCEKNSKAKLIALSNIIDRGYRPIAGLKQDETDTILSELAKLNNKEFTYRNILNRTRFKRREKINSVIDFYKNNGILLCKRRKLFISEKISYHVVYSFIDAGLAYYISRENYSAESNDGFDLESIVFSQIKNWQNSYPFPFNIYYYIPYFITPSGQIKYKSGEIDFIIESNKCIIPVEVKSSNNLNNIKVPVLNRFVKSGKAQFGIVLYQGGPWYDKKSKLFYLPLALL